MTNTHPLTVRFHVARRGAYVLKSETGAESFEAARELATGNVFATVVRTYTGEVVALTDATGTFHKVDAR